MKLLVTGGAGFIGSHLVDYLVKDHDVFVLDNLSTGKKENINKKVADFCEADIISISDLYGNSKVDVVYHLAANASVASSMKDPSADAQTNIMGLLNVIQYCKRNDSRLVFTSTGSIYDSELTRASYESDSPTLKSYYSANKYLGETYIRLSGLNYSIARLGNVYGSRQIGSKESGVIAKFFDDINQNKPLKINAMNTVGDAGCYRDYIHVKDVVSALTKLPRGTFNVACEKAVSTRSLALTMYNILRKEPNLQYGANRTGDSPIHYLSIKNLTDQTDWQPKITLEHGLREL